MKRNLFLLIAFIMLISQNALLAALPVTPSTDTGAGATWYRIKNLRAADGGKAAYMKAEAYNQAVIMADIDDADNFLWCLSVMKLTDSRFIIKPFWKMAQD